MHHPTDRITHTTVFVIPVVEHWLERKIAQWVHLEGSIQRPIASRECYFVRNIELTICEKKHFVFYLIRLSDKNSVFAYKKIKKENQ